MSQSKMDVAQDLNMLLEGCRMGIATFEDYLEQCQAVTLRKQLAEALQVFHRHKEAIEKHLTSLHSPIEGSKMGSMMAEFFEKIKAEMAQDDRQLLDYAIRGLDMGLKGCTDFKDRHHDLQHDLLEAVNELESDYKRLYQNLIDCKLN